MASHILAHSGYRATFFIDGNEALEHFRAHPYDFDIIITDLLMPNKEGLDLIAANLVGGGRAAEQTRQGLDQQGQPKALVTRSPPGRNPLV